jgi:hypothetical protein
VHFSIEDRLLALAKFHTTPPASPCTRRRRREQEENDLRCTVYAITRRVIHFQKSKSKREKEAQQDN